MAGPLRPEIIVSALSVENPPRHTTMTNDQISQEILLDEEGIALNNLSHQRSLKLEGAHVASTTLEGALEENARKKAGLARRVSMGIKTRETLAMGRIYR